LTDTALTRAVPSALPLSSTNRNLRPGVAETVTLSLHVDQPRGETVWVQVRGTSTTTVSPEAILAGREVVGLCGTARLSAFEGGVRTMDDKSVSASTLAYR